MLSATAHMKEFACRRVVLEFQNATAGRKELDLIDTGRPWWSVATVLVVLSVLEFDIKDLAAELGLGVIDDRGQRQDLACRYRRTGTVLLIGQGAHRREANEHENEHRKQWVGRDHQALFDVPPEQWMNGQRTIGANLTPLTMRRSSRVQVDGVSVLGKGAAEHPSGFSAPLS